MKNSKKCSASITISNVDNSIKRHNDDHSSNSIVSNGQIITHKATQELKEKVLNNRSIKLKDCYNETQRQLINENAPDRAIAAFFPTYKSITYTLSKIRSSNKPSISSDFSKFEINDDYVFTLNKVKKGKLNFFSIRSIRSIQIT